MTIKKGSKVTMNYNIKVEGEVITSSEGKEPLDFVQGAGEMISGVDKNVLGMKVGEKKTITVVPEDGFGEYNEEAVRKVPRAAFDNPEELAVGSIIGVRGDDQDFEAVIVEVSKEDVVMDMNHPLAGKTLEFEVEIISVE